MCNKLPIADRYGKDLLSLSVRSTRGNCSCDIGVRVLEDASVLWRSNRSASAVMAAVWSIETYPLSRSCVTRAPRTYRISPVSLSLMVNRSRRGNLFQFFMKTAVE